MARILYFAGLVDAVGTASEEVILPAEVNDVRTLIAWLRRRGPQYEQALARGSVRVTVNKQFAEFDTQVAPDDEIALVGMPR